MVREKVPVPEKAPICPSCGLQMHPVVRLRESSIVPVGSFLGRWICSCAEMISEEAA